MVSNKLYDLCPLSVRYINEPFVSGGRSYTFLSFQLHVCSCLIDRNNFNSRKVTDSGQTGYIGEFEEVDDHRNGKIVVQLNGRLNKTGVISPRYNVQLKDLEKWVVKLLPSRQFGYMVLTTSAGIMDHEEARRKHVSGKIIGFFY